MIEKRISAGAVRRLKFTGGNDFQMALRKRVQERLRERGRPERGLAGMYAKTAVILAAYLALYVALVGFTSTWWQAVPLSILMGLAAAAVGFNIMHDAGHKAFSTREGVNRFAFNAAMALVGGSAYCWHWKHGVFHHTYANITGYDTDISLGALARLSPHQAHRPWHRYQHLYIWPLYGLAALKWHLFDDFRDVLTGRMDGVAFPRPRGKALAGFVAGKIIFFSLVFVIPGLFHPLWAVAGCYLIAAIVLGFVISFVFQLAHCVEEARFPVPDAPGRIENSWGIHQIETTVDFARGSRLAAWLLGGLNMQVEHHLFSRICHVNYPHVTDVVERMCRAHGIRYQAHESVRAGLASHFRWLRRMGRAERGAP